ncbi:hypothetical protein METHB2_600003 [Candidatus Methylobacter favarea]|uniref:Helix-turn-helix domain-containing protein n=1 Tax=Candidatus Methylobacter favarea TaxID=2707345 RepID=A0A8S0XU09_9GAMM|nr:helix-turn-helix domain-containing protein [Candidatus Methylobacter favarea]CAA9892208.1 hypothetical protein METHB2_600003 [Candidatus Methylobacter favarea]
MPDFQNSYGNQTMNKNNRKIPAICSILAAILIGMVYQAGAAEIAPPPEVLTAQEASALLRVPGAELIRMADAREIPGRKFGREWRFNRTAVMAWLAGKDPVGAVLITREVEKSTDKPDPQPVAEARSKRSVELLAQAELENTAGRGVDTTAPADKSNKKPPLTIGEKPKTKTAEEVFLRDQAVLLKAGQMTLEMDLLYARSDRNDLIPVQVNFLDSSVIQGQSKSDSYSSNFSVRYGLFNNLQVFGSIPLSHQSQTLSFGSQEISTNVNTLGRCYYGAALRRFG